MAELQNSTSARFFLRASPGDRVIIWARKFPQQDGRNEAGNPFAKVTDYSGGIRQSISCCPLCRRKALLFENGWLPKKPAWADNGLG